MTAPQIIETTRTMAQVIASLHNSALDQHWTAEAAQKLLDLPGTVAFVALARDQEPAGHVLALGAGETTDIVTIGVAPNFRRQGVGRALLAALLRRSAERGYSGVTLEVDEANIAARALYEGMGFTVRGRRAGYYRHADGAKDGLILRIDFQ